jgi:hypothetical protein
MPALILGEAECAMAAMKAVQSRLPENNNAIANSHCHVLCARYSLIPVVVGFLQMQKSRGHMLQKLSERHFNSVLLYGAIAISALVGTALFSALATVP